MRSIVATGGRHAKPDHRPDRSIVSPRRCRTVEARARHSFGLALPRANWYSGILVLGPWSLVLSGSARVPSGSAGPEPGAGEDRPGCAPQDQGPRTKDQRTMRILSGIQPSGALHIGN